MIAPEHLRIAIIGAGPAGLTFAYWLGRLGLRAVQIFEASDEVGGQSVTRSVDGFAVELGTAYLAPGSRLAKRIAAEVGCPAEPLPPATLLDATGKIIHPDAPGSSARVRYGLAWLHWSLGGQMRVPSHPDNAQSFADWLRGHGLADWTTEVAFGASMAARLHGPLDAISAHRGLCEMRPSLLLTRSPQPSAWIPLGFQNLWKRLTQQLGFPIRLRQRIDTVRPIPGRDRRQVELLFEGKRIDEPFDHVILACPLDRLEDHPVEHVRGSPLAAIDHPLSRALRERYSAFAASEVYSAAWRATNWPAQATSRCSLPAGATGEPGRWLTLRRCGQIGGRFVGQLCVHALPEVPPAADEERFARHAMRLRANRERVIADMRGIVGLDEVEIVHERLWRHDVRYSCRQIEEGLPGFIDASQGTRNVWYTGGALSQWSIDAIADFNRRLARRFARQIRLPLRARLKLIRPGDLLNDL